MLLFVGCSLERLLQLLNHPSHLKGEKGKRSFESIRIIYHGRICRRSSSNRDGDFPEIWSHSTQTTREVVRGADDYLIQCRKGD